MKKAIIFDLDGTLWDSSQQVSEMWNQVFDRYPELHLHLSQLDIERFMGKTMEEIGEILMPDRDEAFRAKIMNECGEEECVYLKEHGAILFPGLRETIDILKENFLLYIVSNCQDGYIESFLEAHGFVNDFDDFEMSGRTGKGKGENIQLLMERNHIKKAVYVGDTVMDEQAAHYAGIPFIHAAYGFGSADQPDAIIHSFTELLDIVRE